jgi:hypothetical protein
VSAFVAHGVFPKEAWKRFARGGDRNVFDKFWLTNSIPTITSALPKDDVFEVRGWGERERERERETRGIGDWGMRISPLPHSPHLPHPFTLLPLLFSRTHLLAGA